ncbi:MAG TPA: hypothetical protein IGS52_25565 [Oscillatoriaceae cyanobacterium M33_DOE_052]|uniref:Uncharacterized protein n=1 Tax=Planktothricoides sp. SpSt-374 TaxID=2282167 RepID=A0A7C3ZT56_9CYAN|nr:hypothetical protein [[Phormidium] sp. ETS-05]HIK13587.1 hypothetical protein [Oscillatoriaceae cyanobacterium M33_DOE_052]
MGKKKSKQKTNLLYQRLEEALEQGAQVWIETDASSFSGIPINLTEDFLEIMVITSPEDEDEEGNDVYERTTWLIRLEAIAAMAYQSQYWSKDRLEGIFAS